MDQNQPIPVPLTTTGKDADADAELLQAQAELWCHTCRHMESMILKCAIDLGIPSAIHRNSDSASLPELLATLPIAANKKPFLSRLMGLLAASGIFTEGTSSDGTTSVYQLTRVSQFLVDSIPVNLLPFTKGAISSTISDVWGAISLNKTLAMGFNASMVSNSNFLAKIAIRKHAEAFMGVRSLVDVGGRDGLMARAIVEAFPHINCMVLDLPHVVHGIPADGLVEYVAGDMMDFVPPANVVLLKLVLHNWSDEDCVKILSRCREAISNEEEGKLIIIDTVIGTPWMYA